MGVNFGGSKLGNIVTDGLLMHIDMASAYSYRQNTNSLIVKDLSGRNANAIMSSSSYITDAGGGLQIGAKTEGVTGVANSITINNTVSMGIWLYPTLAGITSNILMLSSSTNTGGTATVNFAYQGSSGETLVAANIGTAGGTLSAGSSTAWTVGAYQYYMMTFNGTNLIFYKNGTSVATNNTGGTYKNANVPSDYLIGANNAQSFALPTTRIYMAHIYNRALSAAEVTQNFNAHRGRFGV